MSTGAKAGPVLLIGVGGQVGSELAERLGRRTSEFGPVYGTEHPAMLAPVLESAGKVLHRVLPLDLTSHDAIDALFREVSPSLVINAAAYTAVDKAETERDLCEIINDKAVGWIGAAAHKLGCTVIHYSTDYVYDGSGSSPRTESAPTGPLNWYGQTKLNGETSLLAATPHALIFRTSWVVSRHGNNFIKTMLRFGMEREEMKVVADQYGAPTTASEIAEATVAVVQNLRTNPKAGQSKYGVYHMVCSGETTWHGFAEAIFSAATANGAKLAVKRVLPIQTSDWPTPAKRPMNSRLSCQKLADQFGVKLAHWRPAIETVVSELTR
jgi:dTDP-4-dehydrorhamnose reductase